MIDVLRIALMAGLVAVPLAAVAEDGRSPSRVSAARDAGGIGGRAPWQQNWEYDSGSGNDRRPELPYYQQGRGQQTGGPARNLLPDDGLRLSCALAKSC